MHFYFIVGYRKDLEWAMWAEDKEIKTDEEWDKPWLRNYTYGFYAWPKKLQVKNMLNKKIACNNNYIKLKSFITCKRQSCDILVQY